MYYWFIIFLECERGQLRHFLGVVSNQLGLPSLDCLFAGLELSHVCSRRWVRVNHKADISCFQVLHDFLCEVLNFMNERVGPLWVLNDSWNFFGREQGVVEFELVRHEGVAAELGGEVLGTLHEHFEVHVFLADQLLSLVDNELLWDRVLIDVAVDRARSVPD